MNHDSAFAPSVPAGLRERGGIRISTATLWAVGILLAHAPLALALQRSSQLATLHALGTLALGVYWATQRRRLDRAVYTTAYLAGAEVLWRMTAADVFWEYGKYAITLMLGLLILRIRPHNRLTALAAVYFLLLVPSCIPTVAALGWTMEARQAVSFNLSGPLSLAVAVMFFSGFAAPQIRIDRLLRSLLYPIAGILTLAAYSTVTAENLSFTRESNFVTSGGFGPNQVSAMLGLGAVVALLLALHALDTTSRWIFAGLSGLFLVQAVLTFSRGGIFNVAVCIGVLGFHYIQDRRMRRTFVALFVVVVPIGYKFVLPRLDEWTGGMLRERYASIDPTGRTEIAASELEIWGQHPVAGVGVGMSRHIRTARDLGAASAHTEFTRLLAEHGSVGAAALVVLFVIGWLAYRSAPDAVARAWVALLCGWAVAEMAHAAMRIATIGFLFGLATMPWTPALRRPRPVRV